MKVRVYIQMVSVLHSIQAASNFLYLMTWEYEYLGLQRLIISILGSKNFEDLFDLSFRRAHLLRTFFNFQPGEGSYLDGE